MNKGYIQIERAERSARLTALCGIVSGHMGHACALERVQSCPVFMLWADATQYHIPGGRMGVTDIQKTMRLDDLGTYVFHRELGSFRVNTK